MTPHSARPPLMSSSAVSAVKGKTKEMQKKLFGSTSSGKDNGNNNLAPSQPLQSFSDTSASPASVNAKSPAQQSAATMAHAAEGQALLDNPPLSIRTNVPQRAEETPMLPKTRTTNKDTSGHGTTGTPNLNQRSTSPSENRKTNESWIHVENGTQGTNGIAGLKSPEPNNKVYSPELDTRTRSGRSLRESLQEAYGPRYRSVESHRLAEDEVKKRHWKRIGPYLSERQWATVREDYSENGDAWSYFPHEHARSRAYRWGEDGLAGICDNHQRLCFSLGLWNGADRILKERIFGVTSHQGNHGEDVKELYYYLDSTPTHSYMKFLYKYPQRPFPYEQLVDENRNRGREVSEFEITDTDAFADDKYWDVFVEYAKDEDDPNAMSIRITAYNRGPDAADLWIVPQMFFRNTWDWAAQRPKDMPNMKLASENLIQADHDTLGTTHFYCIPSPSPAGPARKGVIPESEGPTVMPDLMFTNNETNKQFLWGAQNATPYTKDAFHNHIIVEHRPPHPELESLGPPSELTTRLGYSPVPAEGLYDDVELQRQALAQHHIDSSKDWKDDRVYVNPDKQGTKAGACYHFSDVPANGGCAVVRVKWTPKTVEQDPSVWDEEVFDNNIDARREDADEFYQQVTLGLNDTDLLNVQRQALGGMMWNKQYYQFIQKEWIEGDPGQPPPPPGRKWVRNREWKNLYISDILSMPDKWEYPFFAAWDTAFHCIPLALIDPAFAKKQLDLLTREWYMKPDGALPAYEWNFSDVNPPVHAWATFRVFKIERRIHGREDLDFLERVFQKLLINFTWWVNRKDSGGNDVFEGGFLGLDNIGCFNRSEPLPTGGVLRQADGTAWMAFYCLNMLSIALELAKHNPTYEDIASKFFEHFLYIADAMTYKSPLRPEEDTLWNEEDGFYYDAICHGDYTQQLKIKSLVGLIPLMATLVIEPALLRRFPQFKKRMDWLIERRPEILHRSIANMKVKGKEDRLLLALCDEHRLRRILNRLLDEDQFLAQTGLRSLSREHLANPFSITINHQTFGVEYWPADSKSGMFGGNSNWRGPIWLATNFLLIEGLQRFHQYYGESFQIECPIGSGDNMSLGGVAQEIQHRNTHLFARDFDGRRAYNGGNTKFDTDPHFRDLLQFHEFFHADSGAGLGASHQTGWTGLVAWHIYQTGLRCRLPRTPRTPRSQAAHYFQDSVHDDDDARSVISVGSNADFDELGPQDL